MSLVRVKNRASDLEVAKRRHLISPARKCWESTPLDESLQGRHKKAPAFQFGERRAPIIMSRRGLLLLHHASLDGPASFDDWPGVQRERYIPLLIYLDRLRQIYKRKWHALL
jgi:hypothetical protein